MFLNAYIFQSGMSDSGSDEDELIGGDDGVDIIVHLIPSDTSTVSGETEPNSGSSGSNAQSNSNNETTSTADMSVNTGEEAEQVSSYVILFSIRPEYLKYIHIFDTFTISIPICS